MFSSGNPPYQNSSSLLAQSIEYTNKAFIRSGGSS